MEDLKKEVNKIVDIAKECPENLQQTCFEILLRDFLDSRKPTQGKEKESQSSTERKAKETTTGEKGGTETEVSSSQGSDLILTDLHVKARKFMDKYKITIEQLNQLFYKESGNILPLFDDLKTTRTSECQVRLALLKALVNALSSGEFQANVEEIRSECQARKCYDTNNWNNNFQNNADLFDFGKYTKDLKTVRLSEDGKKELAELIGELQ
jgi:hypothetical protein